MLLVHFKDSAASGDMRGKRTEREITGPLSKGEAMNVTNKPLQTGRVEDETAVELSRLHLFKLLTQVGGEQMGQCREWEEVHVLRVVGYYTVIFHGPGQ